MTTPKPMHLEDYPSRARILCTLVALFELLLPEYDSVARDDSKSTPPDRTTKSEVLVVSGTQKILVDRFVSLNCWTDWEVNEA